MSTTVRVNDATHDRLVSLARATGHPMNAVIDDALAAYEERTFWDAFNEGYDRLSADSAAWAEVQAERDGEAPALGDDLDETPR